MSKTATGKSKLTGVTCLLSQDAAILSDSLNPLGSSLGILGLSECPSTTMTISGLTATLFLHPRLTLPIVETGGHILQHIPQQHVFTHPDLNRTFGHAGGLSSIQPLPVVWHRTYSEPTSCSWSLSLNYILGTGHKGANSQRAN